MIHVCIWTVILGSERTSGSLAPWPQQFTHLMECIPSNLGNPLSRSARVLPETAVSDSATPDTQQARDDEDDDTCAICYTRLAEKATACGHKFCTTCLAQYAMQVWDDHPQDPTVVVHCRMCR